jgi:pimeloyl-ACP methyl ester carboxylesterase
LRRRRRCGPLQNPVPPEFARQFQASTAYRPMPEAFLEQLVAESRKLSARLWREVLEGVLAFDDAADLDRIKAPTLVIWGEHDARFPARSRSAWWPRSPTLGCWCTPRPATARIGNAPSGSPGTWTPLCERDSCHRQPSARQALAEAQSRTLWR